MPQVPYTPEPTQSGLVGGYGTGSHGLNIQAPGAAFGTNIGAALEKFGATMEQSGGELFQRAVAIQALKNESDARNADAAYMEEMGKLHADFSSKEGTNAGPEALQSYIQQANEARQRYRNSLGSPMARQMYDQSSMYTMGRNIFNAAGHSGEETKKSYVNSINAQKVNTTSSLEQDPSNTNFKAVDDANRSMNERLGKELGWTPEQVEKANRDDFNRQVDRRVTRLARDMPEQARQILEDTRSKLDGDVAARLEDVVQTGEAVRGTTNLVSEIFAKDKVTADTPPGKLRELEEEAFSEAKQRWPNNTRAQNQAVEQVQIQYGRLRAVQRDDLQAKIKTVDDFVSGGGDPAKLVRNVDDIYKNPFVAETFQNLPVEQQNHFISQIRTNARNDAMHDTPERTANYQRLDGMSGAGNAKEFADKDLSGEDLTLKERMTLLKKQADIRKGQAVESHSSHIMQDADVKTTLYNAGIIDDNDKPTDKNQFNRLHGMINSDIQNYMERFGKWPSEDDERKIVYRAIQKQGTYPAWFGITTKYKPMFQEGLPSIPDKVKGDLTRKLKSEGIETPTDEQIFQELYRMQGGRGR